ncbi:MAG TPA: teichoic acid transporter, partial [Clostridium sp.]|nr:teichoic acid transporter [Clostridium sp.]
MDKSIESNNKALVQLLFMILLTLLTQGVSLIKASVTAANFGATVEMDAFNFSNSIGTFIFSFIGTGVTTVLIPAIINRKEKKSIDNFITVLYGISLLCVIILFFFRRFIASLFSSNSTQFIEIACSIMLITLIAQFLNTILSVFNAVFQCEEKFNIPKVITLITTSILTLLVFLNKDMSIYQFAIFIFITSALNLIIQGAFVYRYNFRYKPVIDFKDEEFKKMITIFIPTMFSAGLYQISLLTDSLISSKLGPGQISILSYSNNIMNMINLLLLSNLMTYIYPKVTKQINQNNGSNQLFNYMIFFNAIMFLMVCGFIVVGKEGIVLLYQRGKFDSSITQLVYSCTFIYIIGLPINVMRDLVYRYFYAKGNTKSTFKNSISASIVNIIVSIALASFIGLYGVVIGTVITSIFSFTSIMIRLKHQYNVKIDKNYVFIENSKIVISSVIVIVSIIFIKSIIIITNPLLSIVLFG